MVALCLAHALHAAAYKLLQGRSIPRAQRLQSATATLAIIATAALAISVYRPSTNALTLKTNLLRAHVIGTVVTPLTKLPFASLTRDGARRVLTGVRQPAEERRTPAAHAELTEERHGT